MAAAAAPDLDPILGSLAIGAWISCFFYGFECVAVYYYFTHFKRDHIFLKSVILAMFLNDTTNCTLQCVIVYLQSVTHFGDYEFLSKGTVYFALQVLLPSTTALICQCFLIWRFSKISKNYIVAGLLCLPVLGAYISVIYATIALFIYTSLADRVKVVTIGTCWLSFEASADILIATALILTFANYHKKTTFTDTHSLLKKLMLNAAETGAITATVAIAMLMAFLMSKTTNINTGFSFVLGRVYALTLFANLNTRARADMDLDVPTSQQRSSIKKTGFGHSTFRVNPGSSAVGLDIHGAQSGTHFNGAIDVQREVTVHIDNAYSGSDEKGDTHSGSDTYEMKRNPRHEDF